MAGGSRFKVTPAAAPEQPEIKQLLNALSPRGPLPNLSSNTQALEAHEFSGKAGATCCTPSPNEVTKTPPKSAFCPPIGTSLKRQQIGAHSAFLESSTPSREGLERKTGAKTCSRPRPRGAWEPVAKVGSEMVVA